MPSSTEDLSSSSSAKERKKNKRIDKKIEKIQKKKKSRLDSRNSSFDRDRWGTPLLLHRHLDGIFHFVADMAASDDNHLHSTYFTKERSAFDVNWSTIPGMKPFTRGSCCVFANPPYSNVEPWMQKAVTEWRRGVSTLMLLKCGDGESYWQENMEGKASEYCLIRGRLKFRHPETLVPQKGCNFGVCLVYWDACKQEVKGTNLTFLDARRFS